MKIARWKIVACLGGAGIVTGLAGQSFPVFLRDIPVGTSGLMPLLLILSVGFATLAFGFVGRLYRDNEVAVKTSPKATAECFDLLNVRVIQEEGACYFPIFDFSLRNTNGEAAVLAAVEVVVTGAEPVYGSPVSLEAVVVSEPYNVMLDPAAPSAIGTVSLGNAVLPGETERIQVKVASLPVPPGPDGWHMVATRYHLEFMICEGGGRRIAAGPFCVTISYPDGLVYQKPSKLLGATLQEKVLALKDPHPSVRMQAADLLGLAGGRRCVPALVQALDDDNGQVAFRAALSLARHSHPRAVDRLEETLQCALCNGVPALEEWQVNQAVRALRRVGGRRAGMALTCTLGAFELQGLPVREMIVALAEIGDTDALPVLAHIASDETHWFSREASDAMGKIRARGDLLRSESAA